MHTSEDITAKQLQRELGVTYKTAWKIRKQLCLIAQRRRIGKIRLITEMVSEEFRRKVEKNYANLKNK